MLRDARWLIVGADGAIGSALANRFPQALRTTRRTASDNALSLDLSCDLAAWPIPDRIEVAFLCAAITSIEQCRKQPAETRHVNVSRMVQIATRLQARGAHVVFLSTNQVFDGSRPHIRPDERTNPLSEYGRQKADAERAILAAGGATVVRFTKVVVSAMPLLRTWAVALRSGAIIEPFDDMVMSPVSLEFAVDALARIGERKPGGIVQVSGDNDASYAAIARRLAHRVGASCDLVRPVSCRERGIPRESAPLHTTLDTARLTSEFSLTVPRVNETLDALIEGTLHG